MTDWVARFGGFGSEILPAKSTKLTPPQAAQALSKGYRIVNGRKPNKSILGLLISQSALETGDWQHINNYNFAGVKATPSDPYVQYLRCFEVVNGETIWYEAGSPECKFAAFHTPEDGAARYISVLKKRSHWWDGLHSGTVSGFVDGLTTAPAYFTANKSHYETIMADKFNKYESLAEKYSESIFVQLGIATVVLGAGYYGWKKYHA